MPLPLSLPVPVPLPLLGPEPMFWGGDGDEALMQFSVTDSQDMEPEQRQDKLGNLSMNILEKVSKIYAW